MTLSRHAISNSSPLKTKTFLIHCDGRINLMNAPIMRLISFLKRPVESVICFSQQCVITVAVAISEQFYPRPIADQTSQTPYFFLPETVQTVQMTKYAIVLILRQTRAEYVIEAGRLRPWAYVEIKRCANDDAPMPLNLMPL